MMDVEVEKYKGAVKKLKFAIIGSLMFFVVPADDYQNMRAVCPHLLS